MKTVIVESPYAGNVRRNEEYLEHCLLDCLQRGEAPYASHKMYTLCLDDLDPEQRKLGIEAGLAWRRKADERIFYLDFGPSVGMTAALALYIREGLSYVERYLFPRDADPGLALMRKVRIRSW